MPDAALVLAITSDDTMFHVGTAEQLLAHLFPPGDSTDQVLARHGSRPERAVRTGRRLGPAATLELFDGSGHALRVLQDASGRPTALVPSGAGDTDPELLVTRVDGILDRAREHLADHPEEQLAPSAIPGAKGPLPAVLAMLDSYGSGPAPGVRDSLADVLGRWVTGRFELVRAQAPGLAARVPLVGRWVPSGAHPVDPVGPLDPGDVDPLLPGGIPHTGSWFHNLMHRLTG